MTTFVDPNADGYATRRAIALPVMDGLEFANFYGGNSDPERNLAPGKDRAIMRGDPTAQGGNFFIRCEGMVNWIDLPVEALAEFTLICVAKAVLPDAGSVPLISNTGSASQSSGAAILGGAMYLNDAAAGNNLLRLTVVQTANDGGAAASVVASTNDFNASTAGWQMFTGQCNAAGDRIARIMGSALTATTISDKPAMLAQPYRLGGQYNANAKGKVDIAAALIYSRALSEEELDVLYAFVRRLYARRGITI
ncbi:MAG: hypothetical protein VX205_13235 [Pseudomonadota bacterium]|nr:hypothetical protein [Pseudomonadota bacterium]